MLAFFANTKNKRRMIDDRYDVAALIGRTLEVPRPKRVVAEDLHTRLANVHVQWHTKANGGGKEVRISAPRQWLELRNPCPT